MFQPSAVLFQSSIKIRLVQTIFFTTVWDMREKKMHQSFVFNTVNIIDNYYHIENKVKSNISSFSFFDETSHFYYYTKMS